MTNVLTDDDILKLREALSTLSKKKPLAKSQLCQRIFTKLKKAQKLKEEALETRKEILLRNKNYVLAKQALTKAKTALDDAQKEALMDKGTYDAYEEADGARLLHTEEVGILQGMFNTIALACKKDPLKVPFLLFIENENEDTHARFGEHFKYSIGLTGVGIFNRGRGGQTPSGQAAEIAEQQK